MATTMPSRATMATMVPRLTAGVVGGLAGGVVFGILMQAMGMITMVAMLVGSTSTGVGWGVHLVNSAFIGGLFGLLAGRYLASLGAAVGAGVAYGIAWWVFGALLVMPARLGMATFQLDETAWRSLMGHVVFGVVLGAVGAVVVRRAGAAR